MNNKIIIFVGFKPDKNSGGNSIVPCIIKNINKLYTIPIIYFYILLNENFNSEEEMFNNMYNYEEENLPIVKPYMIENMNNIVIYSESIDNIFNFKNVVRFNFYFNINKKSNDNEYNIFYSSSYHKLYNIARNLYGIDELIIKKENIFPNYFYYFLNIDKILNECYDYSNERTNSCYTIRKGLSVPHIRNNLNYHPENSYEILHEQSNIDDLIIIFNKYKYFYSYDGYTTMLQIAALCGCIPIIIPFSGFIKISDFMDEEWYTNGIAYGDSKEQIEYAINTRNNLKISLFKKSEENYNILYKELIDSIYTKFNDKDNLNDEYECIENILLSNKNNNNNENILLVYILDNKINDNKILILTDKINTTNFDYTNYEVFYSINDDNLINSKKYNYIFSEKIINNYNYRFLTHFYLNKYNSKNILKIIPFKYNPSKYINSYKIPTYINYNNNHNLKIPNWIYSYRPNYGPSKIIWAPSWNNFSNNHFIIKMINNIGFTYYKRKTNLADVVATNNPVDIINFHTDINNNLNICIYQENDGNILNMNKKVYFNWFFDPFKNTNDYDNNCLNVYQFSVYSIKRNVLRQKYGLPININDIDEYPNSFPVFFNFHLIFNLINNIDKNKYVRDKSCYTLRKTNDSHTMKFMTSIKDYFIHPENSICIDKNNLQENIDTFLRCDKFYCYDNISFLGVLAVLCGCQTILFCNYEGYKDVRELYKIYIPILYYGMAYNDTPEELEFARNTQHILIDILQKIYINQYKNFFSEDSSYDSILIFLKYLECYFNVSFNE